MPKRPKKKREHHPSAKKQPKAVEYFDPKQTVKWCFRLFDKDKSWHKQPYTEATFRYVACLLKSYSKRTWGQIEQDRRRDHAIEIFKLGKEAQQRLEELKLDDCGPLWRFRFSGLERIWGIRHGRFFQVLWWDPQHKVCPTVK